MNKTPEEIKIYIENVITESLTHYIDEDITIDRLGEIKKEIKNWTFIHTSILMNQFSYNTIFSFNTKIKYICC